MYNAITYMPFILGGITNSTVGESMNSHDIPTPEDFGQWRRQRDRERYAQMSVQQKEKLLKSDVKITNQRKLQPPILEVNTGTCCQCFTATPTEGYP
jgi:hypothetical protein